MPRCNLQLATCHLCHPIMVIWVNSIALCFHLEDFPAFSLCESTFLLHPKVCLSFLFCFSEKSVVAFDLEGAWIRDFGGWYFYGLSIIRPLAFAACLQNGRLFIFLLRAYLSKICHKLRQQKASRIIIRVEWGIGHSMVLHFPPGVCPLSSFKSLKSSLTP